jgi:hypothetical protein
MDFKISTQHIAEVFAAVEIFHNLEQYLLNAKDSDSVDFITREAIDFICAARKFNSSLVAITSPAPFAFQGLPHHGPAPPPPQIEPPTQQTVAAQPHAQLQHDEFKRMRTPIVKNDKYKTEICYHWQMGKCWRKDTDCQFAHGSNDLAKGATMGATMGVTVSKPHVIYCSYCQKDGHTMEDHPPEERKCTICCQYGHWNRQCTEKKYMKKSYRTQYGR